MFQVRLCLAGLPHMAYNPLHRWSRMIAHPRPLIEVFAAYLPFVSRVANGIL